MSRGRVRFVSPEKNMSSMVSKMNSAQCLIELCRSSFTFPLVEQLSRTFRPQARFLRLQLCEGGIEARLYSVFPNYNLPTHISKIDTLGDK